MKRARRSAEEVNTAGVASEKTRKLAYLKLRVKQSDFGELQLALLEDAFREVGGTGRFVDCLEELLDTILQPDTSEDGRFWGRYFRLLNSFVRQGDIGLLTRQWMKIWVALKDRKDDRAKALLALVDELADLEMEPEALLQLWSFAAFNRGPFDSNYITGGWRTLECIADRMDMNPQQKVEFWEKMLKFDQGSVIVWRLARALTETSDDESIGPYWMQKAVRYPDSKAVAEQLAQHWTGDQREIKEFWRTMARQLPDALHFRHFLAESYKQSSGEEEAIAIWADLLDRGLSGSAPCLTLVNESLVIWKLHHALMKSRGFEKTAAFWLESLENHPPKHTYDERAGAWGVYTNLALSTCSTELLETAVVFCPDIDALVNLFRKACTLNKTFDERTFWYRAIDKLGNKVDHRRRWFKLRIAELHKPLHSFVPDSVKQLCNDILDDFVWFQVRSLFQDVENDVEFWTSLLRVKASVWCTRRLVEAMKARGYNSRYIASSLKDWASRHLNASTANYSFLLEIDEHLFPNFNSVDHFERFGFWTSYMGLFPQRNLVTDVLSRWTFRKRSCRDGITAWKWFFANDWASQVQNDEIYRPIIELYNDEVGLAGDNIDELRTIWKDARDFCSSEISKLSEPPEELQKFYEDASACFEVLGR